MVCQLPLSVIDILQAWITEPSKTRRLSKLLPVNRDIKFHEAEWRIYASVNLLSLVQIIAGSAPSHYPNRWWNIVHLNLRNKHQRNINRSSHIFILENAFEYVVYEMAAILYGLNALICHTGAAFLYHTTSRIMISNRNTSLVVFCVRIQVVRLRVIFVTMLSLNSTLPSSSYQRHSNDKFVCICRCKR